MGEGETRRAGRSKGERALMIGWLPSSYY